MPKAACALNIEPSENVVHYNSYFSAIIRSYTLFCIDISTVCSSFFAQANLIVICLADLLLQMSNSACTG